MEPATPLTLTVDGSPVEVPEDGATLLDVLRDRCGVTSAKDGCSPQGQCGCCTVLVDGQPRVACVTPARRVAGRSVTTLEGLGDGAGAAWAEAFCATGGSQCGFCTPGIIVRFEALRAAGVTDRQRAARALHAHLCRCTGWQTVLDAWDARLVGTSRPSFDPERAARRAGLEGGSLQTVGPEVALGRGGFAADDVPDGALVAVPDGAGGWAVGENVAEARAAAGTVQGRRTTIDVEPPLTVPDGDWVATLRTSWTDPAYLETDASWCVPGGDPASPLANGGAFGAKVDSPAPAAARRLADLHGRPVVVRFSREDTVRLGPKRPPVAGGVDASGRGVLRIVRTPGIADVVNAVAPDLEVVEVDMAGPPTSAALRAAGWAEAVALLAAARGSVGTVVAPDGGRASARVDDDGIAVTVQCGDPLDAAVLRSYCVGAAHMAWSWVTSEALTVDADGVVHDLTVRSFGVVRATETPPITVTVEPDDGPPVNGSDAVFAAVAAATWLTRGTPSVWPTGS